MRKYEKIIAKIFKGVTDYVQSTSTVQPTIEDSGFLYAAILSAIADEMFKFDQTYINFREFTHDEKLFHSATGHIPITLVNNIIKYGKRVMSPDYRTISFYYKMFQRLYAIELHENDKDDDIYRYRIYPDEPETLDKEPIINDPYYKATSFTDHVSKRYEVRISTRLYKGGQYLTEFRKKMW